MIPNAAWLGYLMTVSAAETVQVVTSLEAGQLRNQCLTSSKDKYWKGIFPQQ
jgi:hypothetical protein